MQPVVVRQLADRGYRLVAGERRLRAARLAGLEIVPAIIRDVDEDGALELALVENLQREDLNPIDEAQGLRGADGDVGRDAGGGGGAGREGQEHRRQLRCGCSTCRWRCRRCFRGGAVGRTRPGPPRASERRTRYEQERGRRPLRGSRCVRWRRWPAGASARRKVARTKRTEDPVLRDWEERLQRTLGTQVRIERLGTEGTIRIEYYSEEDLERILEALGSLG